MSTATAAQVKSFGRQPTKPPPGTFREVHFPQLALLDKGTNEGMLSRWLHSEGGTVRGLPRTIYFQKAQSPGHDQSTAIGALHEVTFDPEAGILSGKGWLADHPDAHDAVPLIASKALFHNSVDLSEVKVREEVQGEWWGDPDFHVDLHFDEWKLAATTFVGKPAFPDAHGIFPDEITAAITSTGPLVAEAPENKIRILVSEDSDQEIIASATGLPPWEYFHKPETVPQKVIVGTPDENGWIPVYGHLALWESCHDGEEAYCLRVPRPRDNYASYNKPGVLTSRGMVETGPIAMYGGHVPLEKAFDDPANAWCDVRIVPGVHGPWISGVVRPGVDDARVYAARASRISGHWKGGRLKAVVSCSAEGFDVPGSGFSVNSKGEVDELVASYCGPKPTELPPPVASTFSIAADAPQLPPSAWDAFMAENPTFDVQAYLVDVKKRFSRENVEQMLSESDFEFQKAKLLLEIDIDEE